MGLSSNTLLHTTGKEELLGILRDLCFKPAYCNEKVLSGKKTINAAFPMVSFSDFPVSELKYRVSYGNYGIGLTKTWANNNKLNPVIYMAKKSQLISDYFDQFSEISDAIDKDKLNANWVKSVFNLLSYMKNYQGHLIVERLGIDIKEYRFSDEREWRFVPSKSELDKYGIPLLVTGQKYAANKDKWNETLKPLKLSFEIKDINYIIVERESEITEFITYLTDNHKGLGSIGTHKLCSRIISMTRIKNDF